MNAVVQTFKDMGQAKLAIMAMVLVLLIGGFIMFTAKFSSQAMSPIYTDLTLEDSAKIVAELDKQNIPYELKGNGSQIMVPSEQMLRLRLTLASQGLPHGGSIVGYEIFDRSEAMGTSSFVMNINMLRALEGELSRTITSLSQVESARVHLVVPKQELFTRDKQEPTASVVLKMRGVSALDKDQISAVTHLVASAVPGLSPLKVTVLDTKGRMLSGNSGDGDISSTLSKSEEYRIAYQSQLKTTLEGLLEKSVGSGKVKVTVNADIDFDRIVTNSETYDPNGQVARSVQSGEEKEQASEKQGKDNTTAANNLPNAQANQSGNGSNRLVTKTDETINYEISKKVENHVKESGKVNKLSVAVLVDGNYAEEKDGKQTYTPKSEEERKQIDTLVKSAIGFDEKRGDKVEIVNMRFIAPVEDIANTSFVEWLKLELHGSIQIVIFGVVVLAVLLIIVPLVNRVIETTMAAAATHEEESVAIASGAAVASGGFPGMQRMAAVGSGGGGGAAFPGQDLGGEEESSIDLSRITGRVKSSTYNRLNELVDKHPDEALNVIRQWSARRA